MFTGASGKSTYNKFKKHTLNAIFLLAFRFDNREERSVHKKLGSGLRILTISVNFKFI